MTRTSPILALLLLTSAAAPAGALEEPLTLERALELAAEQNEIPEIAAARLERAEAVRRQAIAALLPALTLRGSYVRRAREVTRTIDGDEVVVQAVDAFSGQAVVDTVLFDLRALPIVRATTRSIAAQSAESEELRRALAFDVADTFVGVLSAERLAAAARRRVEVAQATVDDSRVRLEAGLANRNDLTRTDLELATARLASTRAENLVATSRLALGFLIGEDVDVPLVEPTPPDAPSGTREELVSRALAANRELVALDERAEAARLEALAPRLGIVPTLDLAAVYRWTNEAGLSGNDEDWNVGLNLTWEVWDGGSREAFAAQLDAEAREAELVAESRRREVAVDVERAMTDLESAAAARVQADVQNEVARQNAEEVDERFSNGLATALEQADALVAQFEAEAELARQGFAYALARLELERLLGAWPAGTTAPPGETP